EAFFLEVDVANGEDFIHQENLRLEVGGNGKGQAHIHAAGIMFYGRINEFFQLRESHVFIELARYFALAHSLNRAAQVGILSAGEFRVEPGADFEQAPDTPVNFRPARRGLRDARKNLEQSGLAGAVPADEAKNFALANLQGNILEGPEGFLVRAAEEREGRTESPRDGIAQQAAGSLQATAVALADSRSLDDRRAHTRSAMLPSMYLKKARPPRTATRTMATEAIRMEPGAGPRPVSAQRKPSMTPAMGFRP